MMIYCPTAVATVLNIWCSIGFQFYDHTILKLPRCFPSPMVPPECSKVFFPFMILGTSSCCSVLHPALNAG